MMDQHPPHGSMMERQDDTPPEAAVVNVELLACLRESRAFAGLDVEALSEVASRAEVHTLPQGHVLITEGSESRLFYLLMHGQISIQVESIQPAMEVGIAKLGPGEVIGEGALLAKNARSATAVLLQECTVAAFDPDVVLGIMNERPERAALLFRNIAMVLSARQRLTDRRLLNVTRAQFFPQ